MPLKGNLEEVLEGCDVLANSIQKFFFVDFEYDSLGTMWRTKRFVRQVGVKTQHHIDFAEKAAFLKMVEIRIILIKYLHRSLFYQIEVIDLISDANDHFAWLDFLDTNTRKQMLNQINWHFIISRKVIEEAIEEFLFLRRD